MQVGRYDLRLISPDRKQVLVHKQLKDVASCIQGVKNPEHFGFICRETGKNFIGYIFKCQSESVADDLVNGMLLTSEEIEIAFRYCKFFVINYSHYASVWSKSQYQQQKREACTRIFL